MIHLLLFIVQPDFIQGDSKGHMGLSSSPTKVENSVARFEKDIMKIWREVSAKHNIPLFAHYSGVWDSKTSELHPEWARINADSSIDKSAVSLLGGYHKGLMHPQLVELAQDYYKSIHRRNGNSYYPYKKP